VVNFTIDGSAIAATAIADSTGAWSYTPTGLAKWHKHGRERDQTGGNTARLSLSPSRSTTAPRSSGDRPAKVSDRQQGDLDRTVNELTRHPYRL